MKLSIHKVPNAAVILLGKKEIINSKYPQNKISLEDRTNESNIHFDAREFFDGPYYIMIDKLLRTYSLSKQYENEIALITKAVEIGLNEMSKHEKDQKKGQ